jgi:hypothetical protein
MPAALPITGLGWVRIGPRWVKAYFRYHPAGPESWAVKIAAKDFAELGLLQGEPVRLWLPQEPDRDVRLIADRPDDRFVWLAFEPAPRAAEVRVSAAEVFSDRRSRRRAGVQPPSAAAS